jgi:hypothetical protein
MYSEGFDFRVIIAYYKWVVKRYIKSDYMLEISLNLLMMKLDKTSLYFVNDIIFVVFLWAVNVVVLDASVVEK